MTWSHYVREDPFERDYFLTYGSVDLHFLLKSIDRIHAVQGDSAQEHEAQTPPLLR